MSRGRYYYTQGIPAHPPLVPIIIYMALPSDPRLKTLNEVVFPHYYYYYSSYYYYYYCYYY